MSKMFKSLKEIKIEDYIKPIIVISALFIGFVAFDQISKYAAEYYLKDAGTVSFIPGFIDFKLVYNKGAAWGMGDGAIWSRILLCSISWIVFIGLPIYIVYLMAKGKKINTLFTICLGLILAGDFGNLIDRTFFFERGVIDFISIQSWFPGFGIFNIADSCLVVGILLLLVYFIIEEVNEQRAQKAKNEEALKKAKELDKCAKLDVGNNRNQEQSNTKVEEIKENEGK